MTDALRIVIPGEMRGKGRPRFSRAGGFPRVYTDERTANMESWVRLCAVEAGAKVLDGPVQLRVLVLSEVPASWPKKRRAAALAAVERPGKPDLDNVVKLLADALNGICWRDDKQVAEVLARKIYAEEASTVIEVAPL